MLADYLPAFALEGKLEELPLPLLLAQALDLKFGGMLHLQADGGEPWIFFDEGFAAGAHVPRSQDYLGPVLREMGLLDDATFNQSLMKMADSKLMQGQVLLEMGKINEEQLERALAFQLARKLTRLFAIKAGSFSFVEDEELPPPRDPIRVNPYSLIYNGIKNNYEEADFQKGLVWLHGKACRISLGYDERRELFEFPHEDQSDAELLRKFWVPEQFIDSACSGPTVGKMLLLALLYCGMLEIGDASLARVVSSEGAASSSAEPPPPTPAQPAIAAQTATAEPAQRPTDRAQAGRAGSGAAERLHDVPDALRIRINAKFDQVKNGDYWQILEVAPGASIEAIRKSFPILAKVFHPDRAAGFNDAELSQQVATIFARINEAYGTLTDPQRRAEFDRGGNGSGAPPRPEEAKVHFAKAMVCFKKHDFENAAEFVRTAIQLDSKNPFYRAYSFWIPFLQAGGSDAAQIEKARVGLLRIAKDHPDCFVALRFLSLLYKRLNDTEKYQFFLSKAFQVNPKDIEVAREVRLVKMRKQK